MEIEPAFSLQRRYFYHLLNLQGLSGLWFVAHARNNCVITNKYFSTLTESISDHDILRNSKIVSFVIYVSDRQTECCNILQIVKVCLSDREDNFCKCRVQQQYCTDRHSEILFYTVDVFLCNLMGESKRNSGEN